jgi:predicted MFS family arabinose efflux permease
LRICSTQGNPCAHHTSKRARTVLEGTLVAELSPRIDPRSRRNTSSLIARATRRPFILLILSPVVGCCCLPVAIVFRTQSIVYSTLGSIYQHHYDFSPNEAGLSYLGPTSGLLVGALICGKANDRISIYLTHKYKGQTKPEYRLPVMLCSMPIAAAGLFWYGWAAQAHDFG